MTKTNYTDRTTPTNVMERTTASKIAMELERVAATKIQLETLRAVLYEFSWSTSKTAEAFDVDYPEARRMAESLEDMRRKAKDRVEAEEQELRWQACCLDEAAKLAAKPLDAGQLRQRILCQVRFTDGTIGFAEYIGKVLAQGPIPDETMLQRKYDSIDRPASMGVIEILNVEARLPVSQYRAFDETFPLDRVLMEEDDVRRSRAFINGPTTEFDRMGERMSVKEVK